tara:strand:+ start:3269 stop:3727 length:459 start_codon:yes stop_codon:yes gene_type:complete
MRWWSLSNAMMTTVMMDARQRSTFRARATDANDGVDRRRGRRGRRARWSRDVAFSRAARGRIHRSRVSMETSTSLGLTRAADSIDLAASDALYELTRLAGMDVRREVHDAVLELCRARVVPTAVAQVLRSLANKAADARESGVRDALAATGG